MNHKNPLLSTEEVGQFRAEGFLVIPSLLSSSDVKALSDAMDELELKAKSMTSDTFEGVAFFNLHRPCDPFSKEIETVPVEPGLLRRVTYPYAVSKVLDQYRLHTNILRVMQTLLGDDLKQIVNQVNFNPPRRGTGWGWHQDYRFRKPGLEAARENYVQCLIAVDPCNQDTGGLRLIPRSDRKGGLTLDLDPDSSEKSMRTQTHVTPNLSPGDATIFNPFIIHGSTPNLSNNRRRVYINGYARAASCPFGRPVMTDGAPVRAYGPMEYEDDRERLVRASKY